MLIALQSREKFVSLKKDTREDIIAELEEVSDFLVQLHYCVLAFIFLCYIYCKSNVFNIKSKITRYDVLLKSETDTSRKLTQKHQAATLCSEQSRKVGVWTNILEYSAPLVKQSASQMSCWGLQLQISCKRVLIQWMNCLEKQLCE